MWFKLTEDSEVSGVSCSEALLISLPRRRAAKLQPDPFLKKISFCVFASFYPAAPSQVKYKRAFWFEHYEWEMTSQFLFLPFLYRKRVFPKRLELYRPMNKSSTASLCLSVPPLKHVGFYWAASVAVISCDLLPRLLIFLPFLIFSQWSLRSEVCSVSTWWSGGL